MVPSVKNNRGQHKRLHPYLSKVRRFILYSEVYGTTISLEEIIALIKSLPVNYWVNMASKGRFFLDYYENKPEYQNVLFHYYFPPNLAGTREGFIFHRTQFLVLFRLALLHAAAPSSSLPNEDKCKDITAKCLLGINSFLYDLPDTPYHKGSEVEDMHYFLYKLDFFKRSKLLDEEIRFLMHLVQIQFHHSWEDLNNVIGRLKEMIFDIPSSEGFKPSGGNKDLLSDTFQTNFGISSAEYTSLSFGTIARYMTPDKIFKASYHFPINRKTLFSNSTIDKKTINSFFEVVCQSRSEFIKNERDPAMINDFSSLILKPIVSPENNEIYYPTSLLYLQRLLDSGLIWEATGGEFSPELRIYWGEVFEKYCSGICERIEINSNIKPIYIPEVLYTVGGNSKRSCDAILIYNRTAVLLEFKIKYPHLIDTILKGDFKSFNRDINELLIGDESSDKAAKQIDRTIKDIIDGTLKLPGIELGSVTHFFPVVVTLQAWPLSLLTYNYVRKTVRDRNLLNRQYCADLEIWSCQEFEYLEYLLTSQDIKAYDLATIIKQKLSSDYTNLPLEMFLQDIYCKELKGSDHLIAKREEMFEILKSTLKLQA